VADVDNYFTIQNSSRAVFHF